MPEPDNIPIPSGRNQRAGPAAVRHAEGPGPAPSGTSGTVLGNNPQNLETPNGRPELTDANQTLPPPNLPDVPDTGASVPDTCRTGAGQEPPSAGQEAVAAGGGPPEPDPAADAEVAARPLIVNGLISCRPMTSPRDTAAVYEDPDLRELLLIVDLPADTVIEADADAEISFLDLDTHHWPEAPSDSELAAHLSGISPPPDVAWTSHGRGLKLVYIGQHHADRSLAAAFTTPVMFNVELLSHTRHPSSRSSAHPGASCGGITFFETDPDDEFEFRGIGRLTPELRAEALEQLKLEDGCRYDHDHCPIDPDADSDAVDCVVVLEHGVCCHRCMGHGIRYRPNLRPGYVPFSQIVSPTTDLDELTADGVHWTHARLQLMLAYPNLTEPLLEEAYRRALVGAVGGQ